MTQMNLKIKLNRECMHHSLENFQPIVNYCLINEISFSSFFQSAINSQLKSPWKSPAETPANASNTKALKFRQVCVQKPLSAAQNLDSRNLDLKISNFFKKHFSGEKTELETFVNNIAMECKVCDLRVDAALHALSRYKIVKLEKAPNKMSPLLIKLTESGKSLVKSTQLMPAFTHIFKQPFPTVDVRNAFLQRYADAWPGRDYEDHDG